MYEKIRKYTKDIQTGAFSQQESESLSANVRLGLQFRYQQGKVQVNHNWFLGYTKDEDGHLIIDQEQAEVVKRIYREYLSGNSLLKIKRSLEADGVLNGAGRGEWNETNIKQILTNEKYIGDALLHISKHLLIKSIYQQVFLFCPQRVETSGLRELSQERLFHDFCIILPYVAYNVYFSVIYINLNR